MSDWPHASTTFFQSVQKVLQVAALAWRPRSGTVLAVGAAGGVCVWSLGRSPAGGAPAVRTPAGGGAWLSFLRTPGCTCGAHSQASLFQVSLKTLSWLLYFYDSFLKLFKRA